MNQIMPSKMIMRCLLFTRVATVGESGNGVCTGTSLMGETGCVALDSELEAKRAEARAFGKKLAARYMEQAEQWVKRAQEFGSQNKLTARTAANDDAFKMCWSGLNNIVAALDHDPDSSALWKRSVHMLLTMYITDDGDPVQNSAVVLKFMQTAINLSGDNAVAMVKGFGSLLKKRDPHKEHRDLWHQLKTWYKDPASSMDVKEVLLGKYRSENGDPPSTSVTKSLDPKFRMAPLGSQLLEENVNIVKKGHLTTHLLWPSRVSVVNVLDEGLMTVEENNALSEACKSAYDNFVKRAHKKGSGTDNSAFFHDQFREIYDPDFPKRVSPGFGKKSTSAAVYKLWELQHNLSIEHILSGGARKQHAAEFNRNVMFPWCAVYLTGTQHESHTHEDAIVSGVYYSQTPHGSSPLILSDPRGGTHMATSGKKAQTFLPEAPFHHLYHFYPKAGDMILFPSYLVHQVPSNPDIAADPPRIAWPFNLFGDLDAWARVNT